MKTAVGVLSVGVIAAVAAVATVGARHDQESTPSPETQSLAVAHASPRGTGDCSRARPCSFEQAIRRVQAGGVVELGGGRYGAQALDARPVTVRPAAGATPVVESVMVRTAGSTLDHLRIGWIGVLADRTRVVDSDLGGTVDRDPIQIDGGPTDVVIERNRIAGGARGRARGHVDCLQVTAASRLVIRDNDMRQCSNSALFLKPDLGDITDVTVEGNHLAACRPQSPSCQGGVALYVRKAGHLLTRVLVRGNDIVGSASLDAIDGLEVNGNVLDSWVRAPGCPASAGNEIRTRRTPTCPLGPGDHYSGTSSR